MNTTEEMGGFLGWVLGRKADPSPVEVRAHPSRSPMLYPKSFAEFVGQSEMKTLLRTEVESAKREGRTLSHILLAGPPGVGKTAVAHVLAGEMGYGLFESTGAEYQDQKAMLLAADQVTALHEKTGQPVVWLLDEIDGISRSASYAIHSLMTHGWAVWEGQRLYEGLPLSILGTTNYLSLTPRALKSRFGEVIGLDYYSPSELALIAKQSARRMGFDLTDEAAGFIGENAAGEPRRVNVRLLRNVRNLLEGVTIADLSVARRALKLSGLRHKGLSPQQVKYLEFLASSPKGKAGLNSIAAFLATDARECQFEHEPFLLRSRYVQIVPGGRELRPEGLAYLEEASA